MEVQERQGIVLMDVEARKCDDEEHAPSRIDEDINLCHGMEFESDEDAKIFYNKYARQLGFSIRVHSTKISKRDSTRYIRQFVCSKQGLTKNNVSLAKQDGKNLRTDCKAMIEVKRMENGKWFINRFHIEHNHELVSPSKTHFLRSQRKVSSCQKSLINVLIDSGVRPCQVHNVFCQQAGGVANAGKQDYKNYIGNGRRSRIDIRDAQTAIKYFEDMRANDPSFFYQIQYDDEARLFSIFWADAKSISAYSNFGDVVTFDTTYLTNIFRMPFAPIMGLNHHRRSVLFGCALLGDESKESFIWLFKVFLKAMSGHQPISIITDQDRAMTAAIREVFSGSCHRFCMWHIKRKFPEKLSHVYHNHANFLGEFDRCVKESDTTDEFEKRWASFLKRFCLTDNKWLQDLYEDRQHWVPCYFGPRFFAGMSTTQCSESMNVFFDKYMNAKTSLQEFIDQYDKALASRYDDELRADFETIDSVPKLRTKSPLEKQASQVYTHAIFQKFREEMSNSLGYSSREVERDDEISKYKVISFDDNSKVYTVVLDASKPEANCSCKLFEDEGILCRHILLIFTKADIATIPSIYILDRWTVKARYRVVHNPMHHNSQDLKFVHYNELCIKNRKFAELGSKSVQNFNLAMQILDEGLERLSRVDNCDKALEQTNATLLGRHWEKVSNTKGLLPSRRMKPPYEKLKPICQKKNHVSTKDSERSRACSICHQHGYDICTYKRNQQGITTEMTDQNVQLFSSQSSIQSNLERI